MIIVIIAGGSGTRLWPLSTPDYPKHLLTLNGENSLLQNTYQRARKLTDEIYVIPEAGHVHHVREQLPELDNDHLIVEPARRGTASCIVAGLERISREHDKTETVAFIAADNYVRDVTGFAHTFKVADRTAQREKRIVLVGVEPYYPAIGFGYIKKGQMRDEGNLIYEVDSFKEKPDYETAQKYLKSGQYLWNCSYFVATIEVFLDSMEKYAPTIFNEFKDLRVASPKDYEKVYLSFENIAVDYALIEKAKNLLVVPAAFDWMDLGSYQDLHDTVESNEQGNHLSGTAVEVEGVSNSYIRNNDDRPLAVIGLDNVAVISTPNGVLVTRKDLAQKVGDVSKRF